MPTWDPRRPLRTFSTDRANVAASITATSLAFENNLIRQEPTGSRLRVHQLPSKQSPPRNSHLSTPILVSPEQPLSFRLLQPNENATADPRSTLHRFSQRSQSHVRFARETNIFCRRFRRAGRTVLGQPWPARPAGRRRQNKPADQQIERPTTERVYSRPRKRHRSLLRA